MLAGRFRCDRLLKSGNGVDTFVATDLADGSQVVVKRAEEAGLSEGAGARLEHEAEVLRRLSSPPAPPAAGLGRDGGCVYLVQPFLPGITLEDLVARGPLSPAATLQVGIGVLSSLQHAHDHQVLHRDVKPANVIIEEVEGGAGDDGPTVGRAVLVDFGFALSSSLAPSLRDERVGTVRYLAPEAAGLLSGAVDERSDLYSVGILIFECLAGEPPFEGADVGSVLQQHLSAAVPRLTAVGVDVPRALDAVVQRLLRKDPAERYQTAGAALADLSAIAAGMERGEREPTVVIGLHDRGHALTEPAFVARDAELSRLAGLIRRAREKGRGGLVLLDAESGGGKTRLLDELAQQSNPDAWILRGQGVEEAAQRPFQLLEGIVADTVARCRLAPDVAEDLRNQVGDRAGAIVAAVPRLAEVLGGGDGVDGHALGPEAYGENRSIAALGALFDALGALSQPVVVLLDDCQWADGPTLRLLSDWQRSVDRRGSRVVVVAAFRSEEVGSRHVLRGIVPLASMTLERLGPDDVRTLAESMAGPLPSDALETVGSLSEGSPFMAAAVLRGLVETGALFDSPTGWMVDAERLSDVQTSRQAALFLLRRLELLAPATVHLLSVGAVLGKEFDLGLAVELCGQDPERCAIGLAEASRRRIVWVDEHAGRARLLHDKLREALLGRLEVGHRRELHLLAAEAVEAAHPDRVFDLAYHFDAAGRGSRALPYALEAAELARSRHSLDVAATHYRMASRSVPEGDSATRARVAEGLGDVLTLQGAYEEATTQLEVALSLATDKSQRAALEGRLGDVAFKKGDQRSARAHLERAVRKLGGRLPRRAPGFLVALVAEVLVQVAHTLLPRLFLARRARHGADREFLAIRLYSRLAYVYWFSAGKVPCAWAHLREMNLAERYPASPELAQAYSEHAPVMTMAPWFSRGIAYARRSLAIRRDLGDLWGQGQSLNFYGVALYAASRYRESIDKCTEAVRLLDQTGDRWEANTATWHIAFAHYRLGELSEAVEVARTLHCAALTIGDDTAAGISLSGWSRASGGHLAAELMSARMGDRHDDAHTAAEVHVAEGVRLLAEGACGEAVGVLEEADEIVCGAGLRQEYVAPVLPWLATALRSQAEALSPYEASARSVLLRRANRAARRGWRVARFYRNNAPHALRERALLASLAGRERAARRLMTQSLAVADEQGARYEHAQSRRAWGWLGLDLNAVAAEQVVADAEADIAALLPAYEPEGTAVEEAIMPTLSLADRFTTVLAVGRQIASAPSPQAVYGAVREAAVTLLRGEWCHVVDVDDRGPSGPLSGVTGRSVVASGDHSDTVSHSLVRRALEEGRPVVLGEDSAADSADSIVLSGLRSALCAPIFCDGLPVACLYVTHTNVGRLFGDEEVQLTEFIVTLAGAALEHVAGTEARFRSLAQNSSDVITIVDRDATIVYQSSAVTLVFGLEPDRMVRTPLAEWLHPDDAEAVLATIARVVDDGEDPRLVECRLRHDDGSWRHVETAINNLVDDPGVNGVVLNSRDVSDRKRAEQDVRETLEREHRMRQRLQEADKLKTDFVSSVSHELRTPLTSILGYLEMMGDGYGGEMSGEQARMLGIVDRNAQRLLILIEELLIMSRVESGTFRLTAGAVDIAGLVDGALQAVHPDLVGRELDVTVDVAGDADVIQGDAGQLDRVMINLLSNAIKFTPDGGSVTVSACREAESVVIRVGDTGMGIPVDDQARIFERFFRSSATQHLAVPGTGLGLSITKAIIEEHGGAITVSSQPGEGTQVVVELPLVPSGVRNTPETGPVRTPEGEQAATMAE